MAQHTPATPEQLAERKEIIRSLLNAGLTRAEAINEVLQKYPEWDVTRRQVFNYVDEVYQDWDIDAGRINRRAWAMKVLERMDRRLSTVTAKGNDSLAQKIDEAIINMLSLDNPRADVNWRELAKKAGLAPAEMIEAYSKRFPEGKTDDIQQ